MPSVIGDNLVLQQGRKARLWGTASPGERVTVPARSAWGGDPLVVRIGQSTFALRRAEAACVHVEPA